MPLVLDASIKFSSRYLIFFVCQALAVTGKPTTKQQLISLKKWKCLHKHKQYFVLSYVDKFFSLSSHFGSTCSFHFSWRHKHMIIQSSIFLCVCVSVCFRHSNGPNVCLKWSTAYAHVSFWAKYIYIFHVEVVVSHHYESSSFCAYGTVFSVKFKKILPALEYEHGLNVLTFSI